MYYSNRLRKVLLVLSFFVILFGFKHEIKAQDIQFSQFYAEPLYLNPAFAGSAHAVRGILHQRLQWPTIQGKFTTSMMSVDGFSSKYNSGFGLLVSQDFQGASIISSTSAALQYSYELPLSSKLTARGGLEMNLVSRSLDYASLKFPSQYTNESGYIGGSNDLGVARKMFPDVGAGFVIYSPKIWVSLAGNHLNTPNQSFIGGDTKLPLKVSLTAGYKINLKHKEKEQMAYIQDEEKKEVSITPTAHYKLQGKSDQVDLGLYGIYDKMILAAWYRGLPVKNYLPYLKNNESVVVIVGYMIGSISITYSYDFTISRLQPAGTGGAHELNLTYIYHKRPKVTKPMRRLPCPNFYRDRGSLQPHQEVKPSHH